jgi:hypothetical protein
MQKSKLETGVVYGYAKGTSEYRTTSPVIVLDTAHLWTRDRYSKKWNASGQTKYSSDWSRTVGYLVLQVSGFGGAEEQATALATAKALAESFAGPDVTAEAVNSWDSIVRAAEGVSLVVVNNRWVVGPYEDAKAEDAKREADRNAKWVAEHDEQHKRSALVKSINAAMKERGITHEAVTDHSRTYGGHLLSIRADVLASILGIELGES